MNPKDWIHKALDELTVMAPNMSDDSADIWRVVVLIARLLGSPAGPTPPAALVKQLPELLRVVGLPDHQAILDALVDELESDGDPWGPLLDSLIDADDALGVLGLAGRDDAARELSKHVAALMSLYPERSIQLGAFAQMRLETVHDDSVAAEVWRAVERAPAQILADALPAQVLDRVDEIAPLAIVHSWLKTVYSQLQRSFAAFGHAAADIKAYLQPGGLPSSLAASLGELSPLPVELAWGEVRRLELALKDTVKLKAPSMCQLWYSTASESALLTTSRWRLEPGESPVLITATESTDSQTLEDALTRGCRAAGLILVEAADADNQGEDEI